jgi:hypothetical protein
MDARNYSLYALQRMCTDSGRGCSSTRKLSELPTGEAIASNGTSRFHSWTTAEGVECKG